MAIFVLLIFLLGDNYFDDVEDSWGDHGDHAVAKEGDLDLDDLDGFLGDFEPHYEPRSMDDNGWNDLEAIRLICDSSGKRKGIKFCHDRKNWDQHVDMLLSTQGDGGFECRFRMSHDHFMYLVDQIYDGITVNFLKSRQSTRGNDPIYPEIVAAVGLGFLGTGDSIAVLRACRSLRNVYIILQALN